MHIEHCYGKIIFTSFLEIVPDLQELRVQCERSHRKRTVIWIVLTSPNSFSDEMPIFKLDYNYFYHLLHIIIISGTDIVRQIFDEAMPPTLLKKELLIHKNVLEPYYNHLWTNHPLGGSWHLLYPPNKELPQSKQFDLCLLLALIKHLNVFPAPRKGWDVEPPSSDLSKSADILRLCKYRDILLSEILMNGLTELQFNSIWKKVSDILLRLGMKQEDIDKVKENPIENISLDYHQLSIYLGIPVPEIIQRMLSCYQQGTKSLLHKPANHF